ncbi:hypothetical protein EMCRGX_G001592 [Ephydatia muelleri]
MRLELVFALLVIAVVSIGTSAEDSGSQNDVDDELSVRDAFDGDGQSVLGDDGRSVRRSDREKDDRCKACYNVHDLEDTEIEDTDVAISGTDPSNIVHTIITNRIIPSNK